MNPGHKLVLDRGHPFLHKSLVKGSILTLISKSTNGYGQTMYRFSTDIGIQSLEDYEIDRINFKTKEMK